MKKIISLFQRNYDGDRLVRNEIVPGAEWVIAGEGVATIKYDGTCCMIKEGKLYKRYDAKKGKTPPPDFVPAQDPDPVTGHWPGWLLVGDGPEDKWHREAINGRELPDGTYELVGPKVQGNKYQMSRHLLFAHGIEAVSGLPLEFVELKKWFESNMVEGIVWHHPDGRMVKIKRKDFGLSW
jgi:hypothetical protein